MTIETLRQAYHQQIVNDIIRITKGPNGEYPNFADASSIASIKIAWGIFQKISALKNYHLIKGQRAGKSFENITKEFLQGAFDLVSHLRPGEWRYDTTKTDISFFDQYEHLAELHKLSDANPELASALGGNYLIKPDIIISRIPVSDQEINFKKPIVETNKSVATLTPLRQANFPNPKLILHASISCKWTIRSDRSQNTRTEALNLIRNRKGKLPHIVCVTAEPLPTRLAALALGTGDLDCVYHFALHELIAAVRDISNEDQMDILETMIAGRRLRDISDLPFDLAI